MRRLFVAAAVLVSAPLCIDAEERKPATITDLIAQLSSNDFHVRHQAARQLGNLGVAAREAAPALGKLLRDPIAEVRSGAAKALAQIGKPAVEELIAALKDRDAAVRIRAAQALAQAGPDDKEAVPALIAALADKQTEVRAAVVDALGEMGAEGKEAAPRLMRLFHDPSPRVRERIPRALARMGSAAIDPLSNAIGEEKIEVRLDAIKTLALFGPAAKKAVPALRQAMKDDEARVRAAAAEALGLLGREAEDAVPELLAALRDKKRSVHNQAANALVLLTMAGVPGLLERVRQAENKDIWLAAALQNDRAAKAANPLTPLLKNLTDKDAQVRGKAALALGALGTQAQTALPHLTKALTDENAQVRLIVAMAIARIERGKVEDNLAVRRVLREIQNQLNDWQQIQAMANGVVPVAAMPRATPAQIQQLVMTYILFKVTMRAQGNWRQLQEIDRNLESQFQLLQEEAAVPLVQGLNYIAINDLGDC